MQTLTKRVDIVDLVELTQKIQRERRAASEEEKAVLGAWMGWGAYKDAFERDNGEHWAEVGAQLRTLLGKEGTEAALAALNTSYFTDTRYINLMWKIAEDLGFRGGRVLELGCGNGSVMAAAPTGLPVQITGLEREPLSAAIAGLRNPDAHIIVGSLEKTVLVNGTFDLGIGNVPFMDMRVRAFDTDRLSLHNYFIDRYIDAVCLGAHIILITSRYTLDSKDAFQRESLARSANLLGAIRLPNGAHRGAGTQAITDILVLQKKTRRVAWQGHDWQKTSEAIVGGEKINQYFETHRQHILGTPIVDHGLYRHDELKVIAPDNFSEKLAQAAETIVSEARTQGALYVPPADLTSITNIVPLRADGRKEGSYHQDGGQLIQIIEGQPVPVQRKAAEITELAALVQLRDATLALLEAERDYDRADKSIEPLRQHLNRLYDAYKDAYGPVHRAQVITSHKKDGEEIISRRRPGAWVAFVKDPDGVHVLALEYMDEETGEAHKAAIFHQRINVRPERREKAGSAGEALALCLDECGRLDLRVIARLLSIRIADVPAALGDLAYENPEKPGEWLAAEEYLSDNILAKLDDARAMEDVYPGRYARNIAALEKVRPEPVLPSEIVAFLGAHWIPADVIAQFCKELLGREITVSYEGHTDTWEVVEPWDANYEATSKSTWGVSRLNAYKLIEMALNKKTPSIDGYPDDTLLAQEKLAAIQQHFSTWLWKDHERAQKLADIYNRIHNAIVIRKYDGSHLTFPGMSPEWQKKLYPWQRDFVWRAINSGGALDGDPPGAGKTVMEITLAMTLKRLGLINKAAVIVPNHILEQIAAEAQRLYPAASILMVSGDDLTKENRKLFATRIATGDYDLVIMTHSSFGAIGVHPYTEAMTIERRISEYRQVLADIGTDSAKQRKTIKRIEKLIERLRQRQYALMSMKRDDGLTWEQLGITYLIIDEMHLFKRLGLATSIDSLKVQPSQRANDLEMKIRWTEEQNPGKPFAAGFTGTPFSNNMVEAYVMAYYFAQNILREMGLTTVDAFAAQFIEFATRVEIAPNGVGFRQRTGPVRFVNMPEFMILFSYFAQLHGPEILDEKRPAKKEHTITIEPSEETVEYVNWLVERYDLINQKNPLDMPGGYKDNPLVITTHGRLAAVDLSLVGKEVKTAPKLEAVVASMLEVWQRHQVGMAHLPGEHKSLQIGFCDLGTPNKDDDNIYGKIKAMLVAGGMPAKAIRFVHEAKTPRQKEILFVQCRKGEVAILLGSTGKMGTGTNIQDRCAAIHHIDACWRPDEMEQREGRGWRPGNVYTVVEIFRYVQKRTFDAYNWQTLAWKAIPFGQMRSGKVQSREMDELGETAMSYAQVKAAATGDDVVLRQAETDMAISKLLRLQEAYANERHKDAGVAARYRADAANMAREAQTWKALALNAANTDEPGLYVRGQTLTSPDDIGARINKEVQSLLYYSGGKESLGLYAGSPLWVVVTTWEKKYDIELFLGSESRSKAVILSVNKDLLKKKHQGEHVQQLDNCIGNANGRAQELETRSKQAAEKAPPFEAQAQVPFPHLARLEALQAQKATIDQYINLVTDHEKDTDYKDQIATLRAQILQSSVVPETTPTDPSPAAIPAPVVASEETAKAEKPLAELIAGGIVLIYEDRKITNLIGVISALTGRRYTVSGARRLLQTRQVNHVVKVAGEKFYDLAEIEALNERAS